MNADSGLTVRLSPENARSLLFGAKMLEIDPGELLNNYVLSNLGEELEHPRDHMLRAYFSCIEYKAQTTAKRVAVRVMGWERRETGKDWGFLNIDADD